MTVGMVTRSESQKQLHGLSRELQDVHRSLIEVSRQRHELANGPARSRAELLELLMNDEAFVWLRPLSRLIVEIGELAARDPASSEAETEAMCARVRVFISPSDDPDAFGSRYVALLTSEPHVAMSHIGLRARVGRNTA